MTVDELVAYYSELLIFQYVTLPKAAATVQTFVLQAVSDLIIPQVRGAFNLETAVGKQLDVLGEFVGAQRIIPSYLPTQVYLELPDYTDGSAGTRGGFGDYAGPPPTDFWADYTQVNGSYVLSDGEMLQLIQYLAQVNAAYLGLASIDQILFDFFGTNVLLTDNLDMTITYAHNPSDPGTLFGIVNFLGELPHPSGVGVIVA